MKIIISQDGIKREIEASFELCISKDDMKHIIKIFDNFTYGWITIFSRHIVEPVPGPPKQWHE